MTFLSCCQLFRRESIALQPEDRSLPGKPLHSRWPALMSLLVALLGLLAMGSVDRASRAAVLAALRGIRTSGIQIQHLGTGQDAQMVVDLYNQDGSEVRSIVRPNVAAGSAANIYMPADNLAHGTYSAIISADQPIAAIARTDWPESGGAATYNHALTGTLIALPVFAGFSPGAAADPQGRLAGRLSSIVHIQNTDPRRPVTATLRLRDAAGRQLLERKLRIGPGTSVTLDQASTSPLAALPFTAAGSLEVSAATPLAVASHVDVQPWRDAVVAFEALPLRRASTRLLAPLVASGKLSSFIVLLNPGVETRRFSLLYRRNADVSGSACGDKATFHGGTELTVPAAGLTILSQAPGSSLGLPDGCLASAEVRSELPLQAVVMLENAVAGAAGAYSAMRAGDAGRNVALALYRNHHSNLAMTTAYQVMNPDLFVPRKVQLKVKDSNGSAIACSGCSAEIPPGASLLWYPPFVAGLQERVGVYGSATLDADGPVLAIVSDSSENATADMSIFAGMAICTADDGPDSERCLPLVHLPYVAKSEVGWVTSRPLAQIFLPLAWR